MKSDFTYEAENRENSLETYEWDNVWWEHAPDRQHKRVLYIGDSISCGIRRFATEESGDEIYFDGFGTSKAIDNPFFQSSLHIFAEQQGRRDAVIFNNGLHGWHLDDKAYKKAYCKMLEFLKKEFSEVPIAVALSTAVTNSEEQCQTVVRRNKIAGCLADKFSLPVIDLFSVSVECANMHTPDGVHFEEPANRRLAKKILEDLEKILS